MKNLSQAHVRSLYRPLITVFILFVVMSIAGVAYTAWSSSTITITPLQSKLTTSFPVTIGGTDATAVNLAGTVSSQQQSASVTVVPQGIGAPIPTHAAGIMTILNTTAKVQPLAVGTRLKSDSGVIVRTTARVDVPSGGQVTAQVVADPLGEEGNLAPGKFIIVALWPGLQDKIYGQLSQALSGGLAPAGATLSINELTSASNTAEEKIRAALAPDTSGTLTVLDPADVVSVPKPEVASASYTITVTVNITKVTFDQSAFEKLQRQELQKTLADGLTLTKLQTPTVRIQDRTGKDQVVLDVHSSGLASLTSSSAAVQPSVFVGRTTTDIRAKLIDSGNVKTATVTLSPVWRSTTPDQASRITVKLNPAELAPSTK